MKYDKTGKKIIVTTILSLLIAGSIYFAWRRYLWNNPPYSPEINAVLFMAGNNRSQLEKVLKHYGKNPADSLKLKAAEFLIINMPGKY
ncbi:MAG: transglutaminase domain-containing protein, partial [Bacteroidales bacterium]|nr:transglutaminase domain-containing protein [Bacteroidales bacterium]